MDRAIPGAIQPVLGGVRLKRHLLEAEATRMNSMAKTVGLRLRRWLVQLEQAEDIPYERVIGRDPETGHNLTEPVLRADGTPLMVPLLPDQDFRECWELYERTVRGLLVEHRQRAALNLKHGGEPIDDAQFEAGIQDLARRAIVEMPQAQLDDLMAQRTMKAAVAAAKEAERIAKQQLPQPVQQVQQEEPAKDVLDFDSE